MNSLEIGLNIITALSTFAAVIVALVISSRETKLTHENIEASTRPIVMPYLICSRDNTKDHYFIALKNFGTSAATITAFDIDPKLFKLSWGENVEMSNAPLPFEYIVGTVFPPGYELISELDMSAVNRSIIRQHYNKEANYSLVFPIEYKSSTGKSYCEKHIVNLSALHHITAAAEK